MRIVRVRGRGNYVWKKIQLNKSRVFLFLTLLALAFMLFVLNTYPYNSLGVILIPLSYGLGAYAFRQKTIWQKGEEGERRVAEVLDEMDDGIIRLSDVRIPPNRGDADHIILAPNGLIVLEVKNVTGLIECRGDDWRRYKIGRAGGKYEVEMGSPHKQAKRNAKTLKDLLLANQKEVFDGPAPHIWVHAAVVFPDEIKIECENPTADVVRVSEVSDYIRNVTQHKYSNTELKSIGDFLARACS